MSSKNVKIQDKIPEARHIAETYLRQRGTPIQLFELFNRMVKEGFLPDTPSTYKGLSRAISKARVGGHIPGGLIQANPRAKKAPTLITEEQRGPCPEGKIRKIQWRVRAYGSGQHAGPTVDSALFHIEHLAKAQGFKEAQLEAHVYDVDDEELDAKLEAGFNDLTITEFEEQAKATKYGEERTQ